MSVKNPLNSTPLASPTPSSSPVPSMTVVLKISECGKVGVLRRGMQEINVKIVKRVAGDG